MASRGDLQLKCSYVFFSTTNINLGKELKVKAKCSVCECCSVITNSSFEDDLFLCKLTMEFDVSVFKVI